MEDYENASARIPESLTNMDAVRNMQQKGCSV